MNPLKFPLRAQAKAIAAGFGALATGLTSGLSQGDLTVEVIAISMIGALATFYGTFAQSNASS